MQHLCALQLAAGEHAGKWHYTRNGAPTGNCSAIKPCPDCNADGQRLGAKWGDKTECATCNGECWVPKPDDERCYHDTAEEALAHQKEYLLDGLRFVEHDANASRTLHRCEAAGCREHTASYAMSGAYRMWHLCDAHRNRETVATLLHVGEAWES